MSTQTDRPVVIVLDVNETLTDMRPLAGRLQDVGAPAHLLATWFASVLRDGIALSAAGGYAPFPDLGAAVLADLLAGQIEPGRDPAQAAAHVLAGLAQLPLHPDVAPGIARMRECGLRVVALTNGLADSTAGVLRAGGIADHLEHCLSVEAVERWKPAPEPYLYAARTCGVAPGEMVLAAVHPWDVDGARRAGLRAAWINRRGSRYPQLMKAPEIEARDFVALAAVLAQQ
jgi:2-haloacid dehalogenase